MPRLRARRDQKESVVVGYLEGSLYALPASPWTIDVPHDNFCKVCLSAH